MTSTRSIALLGVACDLVASGTGAHLVLRVLLAAAVLVALLRVDRRSAVLLGLQLRPHPDSLKPVLIVSLASVALACVVVWWTWPLYAVGLPPDSRMLRAATQSVLVAPVVEEFFYRAVLMGCLFSRSRFWFRVTVSTAIFTLLHWLYGDAHPMYVGAGLAFAVAFASSRTIWVPILLHSVGNASIWLWNVLVWQVCGSSLCG